MRSASAASRMFEFRWANRLLLIGVMLPILGCGDSRPVPGFDDLLPEETPGAVAEPSGSVVETPRPVDPATGLPVGAVVPESGSGSGGDVGALTGQGGLEPVAIDGSGGGSGGANAEASDPSGDQTEVSESPDTGEPISFQRPEHVRGIYLNAWAAGSNRRRAALIELAKRTEINKFKKSRIPGSSETFGEAEKRIKDDAFHEMRRFLKPEQAKKWDKAHKDHLLGPGGGASFVSMSVGSIDTKSDEPK